MKKIVILLLLCLLVLSLTACGGETVPKDISCEDIIQVYEDAGYYVSHGGHRDEADSAHQCYIKASVSEDSGSDYIYFTTYFTAEDAKEAAEVQKYNLLIWFYATVCGESRWLKTGTYGKIEYSYYNSELIRPFNELVE